MGLIKNGLPTYEQILLEVIFRNLRLVPEFDDDVLLERAPDERSFK